MVSTFSFKFKRAIVVDVIAPPFLSKQQLTAVKKGLPNMKEYRDMNMLASKNSYDYAFIVEAICTSFYYNLENTAYLLMRQEGILKKNLSISKAQKIRDLSVEFAFANTSSQLVNIETLRQFMIKNKIPISVKVAFCDSTESVLDLATKYAPIQAVNNLLSLGIYPIDSALDIAAKWNRIDAVECILKYKINEKKPTPLTATPLHSAAKNDIYSVGIMVIQILMGDTSLMPSITSISTKILDALPESTKILIRYAEKHMMNRDPSGRPTDMEMLNKVRKILEKEEQLERETIANKVIKQEERDSDDNSKMAQVPMHTAVSEDNQAAYGLAFLKQQLLFLSSYLYQASNREPPRGKKKITALANRVFKSNQPRSEQEKELSGMYNQLSQLLARIEKDKDKKEVVLYKQYYIESMNLINRCLSRFQEIDAAGVVKMSSYYDQVKNFQSNIENGLQDYVERMAKKAQKKP